MDATSRPPVGADGHDAGHDKRASLGGDQDRNQRPRDPEGDQPGRQPHRQGRRRRALRGEVGVRKTVRTERERMEVPTRREEVTVDRVPVEGEASESEIGEDEVRVPVTEEEVVVEKRPVAKEEIRIRKDVVEDTEVVEEDVRREEIDIDDETTRGDV